MATIRIEFFGIARQRAGVASSIVESESDAVTLRKILENLVMQFPELASQCIADGRLVAGFVANLNGDRFVSDPSTAIRNGASLLIMSSDAGG